MIPRCCSSTSLRAGLDPQTRLMLWEIIREYYRQPGKTIVLTTHYMEEADALCQRLAIIDHGKIIAHGHAAELKASIPGGYLLRVRFGRPPEACCRAASRTAGRHRGAGPAGPAAADIYADRGGPLVGAIVSAGSIGRRRTARRPHFGTEP